MKILKLFTIALSVFCLLNIQLSSTGDFFSSAYAVDNDQDDQNEQDTGEANNQFNEQADDGIQEYNSENSGWMIADAIVSTLILYAIVVTAIILSITCTKGACGAGTYVAAAGAGIYLAAEIASMIGYQDANKELLISDEELETCKTLDEPGDETSPTDKLFYQENCGQFSKFKKLEESFQVVLTTAKWRFGLQLAALVAFGTATGLEIANTITANGLFATALTAGNSVAAWNVSPACFTACTTLHCPAPPTTCDPVALNWCQQDCTRCGASWVQWGSMITGMQVQYNSIFSGFCSESYQAELLANKTVIAAWFNQSTGCIWQIPPKYGNNPAGYGFGKASVAKALPALKTIITTYQGNF
ncbi:MAG: hypothetical protein HOJ35_04315, partial [Bdellovibrionales bacterium]|nr:hypothetical protein [Bdellovibrionales bacterium]